MKKKNLPFRGFYPSDRPLSENKRKTDKYLNFARELKKNLRITVMTSVVGLFGTVA